MTMTPTATGYRWVPTQDGGVQVLKPRAAHRAVMTAEQSLACLLTKAGLRPQPKHGDHYVAAFEPAALLAEYNARLTAWRDVTR